MTFEGQYLTYLEYKELAGSSAMAEMPFNILEFEARSQIDLRTQNRLVNETEIPEKVKLCVYNLINKLDEYVKNEIDSNIASESIDGYSISYKALGEITQSHKQELGDIMMNDLYGVVVNNIAILYNGVI